jgi:C4-dicarboxylate transporter DctM subunit
MCYALAIGFVTPPYGANLFVASGVSGLSVEEISKHIVPFIVSLIFSLILITYIPEISMFLVNLLFR